ncbi:MULTISPECIES: DNA-binding protein [Vibrio]|uniref:DNA-binding protein n=1 Tax=Vibrio europaeus TaxID=300876 RepID=A0A178JAJ1_9VIBR|nr:MULTISPECIES: DNA-binding protein [Vibrio]MDC5703199.1 DNA-binding protein [Vibrio europaeus]MDC5707834.1 DNA-binding protein [Vibrio europaeus]MDC5713294.1 DNA-binding protein [Vibrio europaeus]MDC5723065.1 DNA-binding protein [Vibrio europaeus]MDC5732669.1 DNA-binding protein [Vibrio europaeus]
MAKDLTESLHDRQNILNNRYALQKAEQHLALGGVQFNGEAVFTKQQVMELFEISERTIERYLSSHSDELKNNGYQILRGSKLREFKALSHGTDIDDGTKTSVLGIFSFRAILNLGMLLTDSERAKELRSRVLDIVIDVLAERAGGHTKFINQRDQEYLMAAFQEENYRKQFTDALDKYVDGNKWKYGRFTNLIYQSIFHENAAEYKKILKLAEKDKIRETMYSEVLTLIASFESGIAHELERQSTSLGRPLTQKEAELLFASFEQHPLFRPLITDARTKMASRDLCFRDALHEKLEAYIKSVPEADFERFLGEKSKSLEEQLSDPETLDVFKRLKDR